MVHHKGAQEPKNSFFRGEDHFDGHTVGGFVHYFAFFPERTNNIGKVVEERGVGA